MARKSRRWVPWAARLCRDILPQPVNGEQVEAVAVLFRQLEQHMGQTLRARLVVEYQRESDGGWDYKFFVEDAKDHAGRTVALPLSLVEEMLAKAVEMAPELFKDAAGDQDNAK